MDEKSEEIIKKHMQNTKEYSKFKKLIKDTKVYETPKELTGELRPYQKIGYSWLVQNIKHHFGCILADDMGLGKTIQVLTTILHFKEENPFDNEPALIIVPPTLISNWENEIKKFTPTLSYYIYHGSNRTFPFEDYDIILTSYGVVRLDLDMFLDKEWFICVIDEAQNIKNPNTQQTKAIKSVEATNKIALTGTPIENKLTDYWSIFDFVNKGYLSSLDNFKTKFVYRIERLEEESTLEKFKTITKPFVLRRLKSDDNIKHELPDKIVNDIYCYLTKKQIKLYNAIMEGISEELDGKTGIERQYDSLLQGKEGSISRTVDVYGRILNEDPVVVPPVSGKNLVLTIDSEIQTLAEKALGERVGAAVVLKPASGEILAMVSYPYFDANIFSKDDASAQYAKLAADKNKPMLNRVVNAEYPPASTFKIIMSTAVLSEKVFPAEKKIECPGRITYGDRVFR